MSNPERPRGGRNNIRPEVVESFGGRLLDAVVNGFSKVRFVERGIPDWLPKSTGIPDSSLLGFDSPYVMMRVYGVYGDKVDRRVEKIMGKVRRRCRELEMSGQGERATEIWIEGMLKVYRKLLKEKDGIRLVWIEETQMWQWLFPILD